GAHEPPVWRIEYAIEDALMRQRQECSLDATNLVRARLLVPREALISGNIRARLLAQRRGSCEQRDQDPCECPNAHRSIPSEVMPGGCGKVDATIVAGITVRSTKRSRTHILWSRVHLRARVHPCTPARLRRPWRALSRGDDPAPVRGFCQSWLSRCPSRASRCPASSIRSSRSARRPSSDRSSGRE